MATVFSSSFSHPLEDSSDTVARDDASASPLHTITPITKNYVYRGEGNANLVLSLPLERKIIRFRKSSQKREEFPNSSFKDHGKEYEERIKREMEFARYVISAYLEPYVQIPEIMYCDPHELTTISEAIRPVRPAKRLRNDETLMKYAMKMMDYTLLPIHLTTPHNDPEEVSLFASKSTFCVEIKPKQGYQLDIEKRSLQCCPYCLMQYYKLRLKMAKAHSSYCPFDLFSGERERMKFALQRLLETPQNNLKIFKDGIVVYDEESTDDQQEQQQQKCTRRKLESILEECFQLDSYNKKDRLDLFCDLISATLLHPFPKKRRENDASTKISLQKLERDHLSQCLDKESENFSASLEMLENLETYIRRMCDKDPLLLKVCNRESREQLPKNSVLGCILTMQKLPYLSKKYVYQIYDKYSDSLNDAVIYTDLINYFKDYEREEKEDCIFTKTLATSLNENVINKSNSVQSANIDEQKKDISSSLNHPSYMYRSCDNEKKNVISNKELVALQHYLLFSTARDCSIMIVFRQLNLEAVTKMPCDYVMKMSEELYFLTNVHIIDLDSKSVHSIEKHHQRDIAILSSVSTMIEEK